MNAWFAGFLSPFSASLRLGVSSVFLIILLCSPAWAAAPSYEEVRAAYRPSEAWLLDRHGEVIGTRRVEGKARRLDWVALADLSPAMQEALIAAEDRRFYEHGGVDWQGLAGAALDNLKRAAQGRRLRGGSTLTMQLAAFLDPTLKASRGRNLGQKWDQAKSAREIEARWSKAQILEAYLNLAPYRGELVGIHAASRGLFRKHPSGLTRAESLLLAALLRGTSSPPATVARRACAVAAVLDARAGVGHPAPQADKATEAQGCSELESLALATLSGRPDPMTADSLAPHLAARLLDKSVKAGALVTSTLDARLQREAVAILGRQLAELSGRHVSDGALVVLDNASGEVLAWVGSSGALSDAAQVDGVTAPRQAGSTLKPFLYGLALEKGVLTAASVLDDAPLEIPTPAGLYVPQNYERDFKGPVSLRTALASSLNVPAVRTLTLVGLEPFAARLRALGLDTLTEEGDYYGWGLALGGADVRLLQLANAYRVLANGGLSSPPRLMPRDKGGAKRIMPAPVAFILGDILSDRSARSLSFGLENALATRSWSAVKTGTSKDMRDNWCIGFSDRFTVAVWVGNFDGSPMQDVSGVTGAAPIWRDLMHFLHAGRAAKAPTAPGGLVRRLVSYEPAVEAARQEWFLPGTDTGEVRLAASAGESGAARILSPGPGTLYALDPDIPPENQRLRFDARSGPGYSWALDGQALGPATRLHHPPTPGRHRLSLLDAEGKEVDAVDFEVRGTVVP
jgi:penicillin-binding protein 1C